MQTPNPKDPTPARKSLGQNFLVNPAISKRIVEACQLSQDDTVLEIGPGKGAITRRIAERVKRLVAVEKDKRLIQGLRESLKESNVEIHQGDILKFDFTQIGEAFKIIGNLPYNIATPIIEKVIDHRDLCHQFFFMVQKEYAERLVAKEGSRTYGALSCFVQYYADVKILFSIAPGNFRPMPKVRSAFLKCQLYKKPPFIAEDEEFLFVVIRKAFQQRRKTLGNALKTVIDKDRWQELTQKTGVEPRKRAEQISIEGYVDLANELKKLAQV